MQKRIAIIDMGTNTFHLLVAEADGKGHYKIIHRDREPVKIGKGGINDSVITEEGIRRALVTMQSFKKSIDLYNVESTYAFGTSALRNARNCVEVLEKIKGCTGIDTTIISGDHEAEYIYKGVRASMEMGDEKSLIVDIGGGSVECIIADNTHVFWKRSFEIGAQRLLEQYHKEDPISLQAIENLRCFFEEKLKPLDEALMRYSTRVLIGASGAFDTLSDIFCIQNNISKTDEQTEIPLTIPGFYAIYDDVIKKNSDDRRKIPGMIEMRVDMIVVASCLIHYILSKNLFTQIRVSTYSLKEGVLASINQTATSVKAS
jgi:exopolyphosphatase/guanosine-5'-triphosphate,3'-diphosphate pyrophosphatase